MRADVNRPGADRPRLTRLILVAPLVWMLTSCADAPAPTSTPTATATRPPTRTPVPAEPTVTESAPNPVPTATATTEAPRQPPERTRYTLSARLNYDAHHVTASEVVTYVNRTDEPLADLLLVVEPQRRPEAFHLNNLRWGDGQPVVGYMLEDGTLSLPLPEPLTPGAWIALSLSFDLHLPAEPDPFGYTERQTNLGNWYPFLPPYRPGEGWLVHAPSAVGEHLVYDVADYDVTLELPDPTHRFTLAAAVPGEHKGETHRYRLEAARTFAWSVSPDYEVLTERAEGIVVTGYVFPEHLAAGEAALRASAEALDLYARYFGPYPHPGMAMVEATFPDGMEYDGLYFLGQEYYEAYPGTPQGYLTTIAVHETAHQWWFGLVGNDQAQEPWLDEMLATYSEVLFFEARYPELMAWWWDFRVNRFEPAGRVDSTVYEFEAFRPYINAVYLQGARFMEALRNRIGDEQFFAFLRAYATQHRHQQVTGGDFFTLLAKYADDDINPVVGSYFNKE
ncbi:MAG: M1 family metallopeptidase [Anaerolineae bacterium]